MQKNEFKLPKSTIEVLQSLNRLEAVEATKLTGNKTPQVFEKITATVLSALNVPVAQFTLLKEHEQIIKNSIGFDINQAPTRTAFCAVTISVADNVLIINDTLQDELFKHSPFVIEPPHVRFYAGCPIVFEGEKVGTLCAYDFVPREHITDEQIDFLLKLAKDIELAIYGEKLSVE